MSKIERDKCKVVTGVSYARMDNSARRAADRHVSMALRNLLRVCPIPRTFLHSAMDSAYRAAQSRGGFHLRGFAVRRALGKRLLIRADPILLESFLDDRVLINGRAEQIFDRFIGGGDWSPLIVPLKPIITHRHAIEIASIPGSDFTQSKAYKFAMIRLGRGRPIQRNFVTLDTPEKIDNYFGYLRQLVESVQSKGIVPRSVYGSSIGLALSSGGTRRLWSELFESDIGVAIDADGTILRFASGKHRTGVATALGLASIPVEVRMVHSEWLARMMRESGLRAVDALLAGITNINHDSA